MDHLCNLCVVFVMLSRPVIAALWSPDMRGSRNFCQGGSSLLLFHKIHFVFLSFSIYCLTLAFEHYRQVYIVHSGLQDESLQVTISKLP